MHQELCVYEIISVYPKYQMYVYLFLIYLATLQRTLIVNLQYSKFYSNMFQWHELRNSLNTGFSINPVINEATSQRRTQKHNK